MECWLAAIIKEHVQAIAKQSAITTINPSNWPMWAILMQHTIVIAKKSKLYQVMVLQPIQISGLLIRVRYNNDYPKMLFRKTTFAAKLEGLTPCILYVQLQGATAPETSSDAMYTHKELLTLCLANAPRLPKKSDRSNE